MAPRILIFSIAMGANYSFYMTSIAAYAPAFLRFNNSVLARVLGIIPIYIEKMPPYSVTHIQKEIKKYNMTPSFLRSRIVIIF